LLREISPLSYGFGRDDKLFMLSLYIIGFLLSIILTVSAYVTVVDNLLSGFTLVVGIIVLAIIQLVVQLVFFLHLAQEKRPRWNLSFFIATVGTILIIVIGSIWIMTHLNYNMTPKQMRQYVQSQDGI